MLLGRLLASAAGGVAALAWTATPATAGPDWIEIGDAGSVIGTAQPTFGSGELRTISGSLSVGAGVNDFEDMFLITVVDPTKFSISVGAANFNPQLFIFNVTLPGQAFGLLGNQGTVDGDFPFLGPIATDGSGAELTLPGVYAIAISGMGRSPISSTGEIFNFASPTEVSGPDGPGGINPHIDWTGVGEVGSYLINLEGSGFYALPAPGALLLFGLTALGVAPRRRR